jgi:hypothetical protein
MITIRKNIEYLDIEKCSTNNFYTSKYYKKIQNEFKAKKYDINVKLNEKKN